MVCLQSEARRKLFQEAQEVFNSIASLRRSQDTPSPTSPRSQSSPLPGTLHSSDPSCGRSYSNCKSNVGLRQNPLRTDSAIGTSQFDSKGRPTQYSQYQNHHMLLSKTQRSLNLNSSSLRTSLTSPSLSFYDRKNEISLNPPPRGACSLDLEDSHPRDDLLTTHWARMTESR